MILPGQNGPLVWPHGKRFAFTVFDDTDSATVANVSPVYALLADLGFRTTKSCWPISGDPSQGRFPGETCEDPHYRDWVLALQAQGFEIGWHNATWHGVPRDRVATALDRFAEVFGHDPKTAANHSWDEGIYWGRCRLTSTNAVLYDLLTRFGERGRYRGHVEGSEYFWGDLCKSRIRYFRNFVFAETNTLKACPWMPYHDPLRPLVNYWFASSEGSNVEMFNRCLAEGNQDRLAEEGGACIMYTHFAAGFCRDGQLDSQFCRLMERLAAKGGWYVPVATLLDFLLEQRGRHEIPANERSRMERRWLFHKIRVGTT